MKKVASSDWSKLPPELLQVVVSKLDFIDILGFKGVCSSWFQAAKGRSCPLTPILMLQLATHNIGDDDEFLKEFGQTVRFFSPLDMNRVIYSPPKEKNQNLERLLNKGLCFGSCHGWIVVLDKDATPFLLNPFSGAEIRLPKLGTFLGYRDFLVMHSFQPNHKVILTANPSFVKDYKVVFMSGENLAFCCPGVFTWRSLSSSRVIYKDVAFHSGKLYAIDSAFNPTQNASRIYTWDLSSAFDVPPIYKIITIPCFPKQVTYNDCSSKYYLASSMEELFLVARFVRRHGVDDLGFRTVGFEIYKVYGKDHQHELALVESLPGQAIFLGAKHSCVVTSIREYDDEGLKGNSIYFTDIANKRVMYYGIGVYSFQDKSINSLCDLQEQTLWVFPGLK